MFGHLCRFASPKQLRDIMATATRLQTGPGVRRYANTYLYIYTMHETTPKTQAGPTHAWWAAFSMSSSATLLVIFFFSRTECKGGSSEGVLGVRTPPLRTHDEYNYYQYPSRVRIKVLRATVYCSSTTHCLKVLLCILRIHHTGVGRI